MCGVSMGSGVCAGKVSGEVQHVLEAAMTILLHAVEADDDKVCAARDANFSARGLNCCLIAQECWGQQTLHLVQLHSRLLAC